MTRKLAGHLLLFQTSAAFTKLFEVSTRNSSHGRQDTLVEMYQLAGKDPVELVQGCPANEPPDGPEPKFRRGNAETQCNSAISYRQHKPASHFAFGESGIIRRAASEDRLHRAKVAGSDVRKLGDHGCQPTKNADIREQSCRNRRFYFRDRR